MKQFPKGIPLILVPVLLISACQDPTPDWAGIYVGQNTELVSPELAAENPVMADTIRRVSLELKPDRTFVLTRAGMPATGNYTLSKESGTLTIKSILGQSIETMSETTKKQNEPIRITRDKNGAIILDDPADFGRKPIILKKETEEEQ